MPALRRTHQSIVAIVAFSPGALAAPFDERTPKPAVDPAFVQQSELWANPYGGARRDVVYTGMARFGLTVDLDEAGLLSGTSAGATGLWIQGKNPSPEAIGDAGIVSNIAGVATVRLFKWWLERRFANGAAGLKVGQIAMDDDFMVLESAQLFINSGFGTLQTEALNIGAPIYPLGALGARLRLEPAKHWELLIGAYDGKAGTEREHRHFSDLKLDTDQGVTWIAELNLRPTLFGRESRLSAGTFYLAGRVEDFERNTPARGLIGPYFMVEHTVSSSGGSDLIAFAHASVALPSHRALATAYADAGLVASGGAWSRPEDQLGAGLLVTRFCDAYRAREAASGNPVTTAEWVLELTYELAVLSWIAVQPSAQWVFEPHFSGDDALALATRVTVEL